MPAGNIDEIGTRPGEYIYIIVSVMVSALFLWRIHSLSANSDN